MTDERMLRAETEESEWLSFWKDMREGWVKFEETKMVPKMKVDAVEKRYVVME
jgi:murein L,D-transpeptidase YafK